MIDIEKTYTDLHSLAEPSWHENETTKYLLDKVPAGLEVIPFEQTGFAVVARGYGEHVIGFRTDIDALTFFNDDEKYFRHSCGHDAHMSVLLSVLNALPKAHKHTYKFIFQPAEETGDGASYVVNSGVMDDIEYLFGMHLRPLEELQKGKFSSGIQHGSNAAIEVVIKTTSGHAARPFQSVNAIGRAVLLYEALKELHFNTFDHVLINMTQLNTNNENSNSIPGEVHLTLDLRAKTNSAMDECLAKVKQTIETIDAEISYEVTGRTYAAVIDEDAENMLADAIIEAKGKKALRPVIITPGAEDFHSYTRERPAIKATMLGIGCGMNHGLHHPEMTFDHEALSDAASIFEQLIADLEANL